jgi:hypothetical protein
MKIGKIIKVYLLATGYGEAEFILTELKKFESAVLRRKGMTTTTIHPDSI